VVEVKVAAGVSGLEQLGTLDTHRGAAVRLAVRVVNASLDVAGLNGKAGRAECRQHELLLLVHETLHEECARARWARVVDVVIESSGESGRCARLIAARRDDGREGGGERNGRDMIDEGCGEWLFAIRRAGTAVELVQQRTGFRG